MNTFLAQQVTPNTTGSTCIVLSGGDINIGLVPNFACRNETNEGRRLTILGAHPTAPSRLQVSPRQAPETMQPSLKFSTCPKAQNFTLEKQVFRSFLKSKATIIHSL
jgi:hypothetical protein